MYLSCKAPCQKTVQILKVYVDSRGARKNYWKKKILKTFNYQGCYPASQSPQALNCCSIGAIF